MYCVFPSLRVERICLAGLPPTPSYFTKVNKPPAPTKIMYCIVLCDVVCGCMRGN